MPRAGTTRTSQRSLPHSICRLAENRSPRYGRWWGSTWFYFYVGTNDDRFRDENEQTYTELRAAHVPHVVFRLYQGGHNWSLWQRHAVTWVHAALGIAAKPR